ncbi:MAG: DUF3800 domain-containing protein [Anaerolineaceae bacterium]
MYLDESGNHDLRKVDPKYPVFCLSGCIFNQIAPVSRPSALNTNTEMPHFVHSKSALCAA